MKTKLMNQLQSLLDLVPALIQKCESRESGFVKSVKQWFTDAENLLAASHKPRLVALTQLQANIVAAQQGVFEPSFALDAAMPKRKAMSAIAVFSLERAREILHILLQSLIKNIEESRTLIRQALLLAHQKGIISKHCKLDDSLDNPTMALWNKLAATQDIRTRLNQVLTLVSYAEALNLMAVVLEELPA